MRNLWRRQKVKPQTCRACRRTIREQKEESLRRNGANCRAGALVWKTCSGFLQHMRTKARMRLPRTDTIKTPNWRFLHLASQNRPAQTVAVAVPATIRYMAARLRQPTPYLRTQHSLSYHDETKTATRYSLYRSRYHHPILRVCRKDQQLLALQQAVGRSGASNQRILEANLRPHVSDDTQKQARQGDKPTKTNLPPRHTRTTPFRLPRTDRLWSARNLCDLAILHSRRH